MHDVLPALAEHGVQIISHMGDLDRANRDHIDRYFQANVFPVLTPLAVDPGIPSRTSRTSAFRWPWCSAAPMARTVLRGEGAQDPAAVVPCLQPNTFVPLEQVVGSNLEYLFPGIEILGWHLFRITATPTS
jgi:polyphosphate kinase